VSVGCQTQVKEILVKAFHYTYRAGCMLSSDMASQVRQHVRKSRTERRQEILDATLEIISTHGLEGATVTRIAAAVGITPGALYRHFENRAALIAEANKAANDRALSWVEMSTAADVLRRLEELADAHAAWTDKHLNSVVRPFFLELASTPGTGLAGGLTITSFKSFRALVELAEEGKRRGIIRADVPAEDVAWAMHMFAWAEDVAIMAGPPEPDGRAALRRNLHRLLAAFGT
jgi:AcrR family transcriptional regulator